MILPSVGCRFWLSGGSGGTGGPGGCGAPGAGLGRGAAAPGGRDGRGDAAGLARAAEGARAEGGHGGSPGTAGEAFPGVHERVPVGMVTGAHGRVVAVADRGAAPGSVGDRDEVAQVSELDTLRC